jgi:hypothetical protein
MAPQFSLWVNTSKYHILIPVILIFYASKQYYIKRNLAYFGLGFSILNNISNNIDILHMVVINVYA